MGQGRPLFFCTNTTLKLRASFYRLSSGETWVHHYEPKSKQQWMEWHHMLSPKKKWRGCQQLEVSWLQSFWKRKMLFLWTSGLEEQQWTPATIVKHSDIWILNIHQVSITRNLNCCSFISYRSHTSVRNTEAITEFGWIVLLPLPYSLEFAWSDYILFRPWKKKAAKEGKQLFLGRNTYYCWKV